MPSRYIRRFIFKRNGFSAWGVLCLVGICCRHCFYDRNSQKLFRQNRTTRLSRAFGTFLESRAPLVPEALYSCSSCLFYTIVVTALVGMAFQIWVVFRGKPSELVVASLMVYNFISCAWPLCGKAFDGLGKDSWVRPQGVVVFLSFLCMVLAVASYLNQNPRALVCGLAGG